jgi:hypothetical protein
LSAERTALQLVCSGLQAVRRIVERRPAKATEEADEPCGGRAGGLETGRAGAFTTTERRQS